MGKGSGKAKKDPKKSSNSSGGYAAAANASATSPEDLLKEGNELLEADNLQEALSRFEEVLRISPTNQTAWYHRGVALAETWDADSPSEELLKSACESFNRVLQLDTSTRSENRYLSLLALGRLLTKAGEVAADRDTASACPGVPEQMLDEALRRFEEALQVQSRWGHEPFDDEAWGPWGEALSARMRLGLSRAEMQTGGTSTEDLESAAALCAAAADKFSKAVEAAVRGEGDDIRWMTFHVELLLHFTEHMRNAFCSERQDVSSAVGTWWSRATEAWQQAIGLAKAVAELADPGSWEPLALRGDVFAEAAKVLAQGRRRAAAAGEAPPTLSVPVPQVPQQAGASGPVECLDQERALMHAENAYAQALSCGGMQALAQVHLAQGDLRLDMARDASGPVKLQMLQSAAEVYQRVASTKEADQSDKQAAWFNLSCVAAQLNEPSKVAQALQRSLKYCPNAIDRTRTLQEAAKDQDLSVLREHPEVAAILSGTQQ